jgi:hypothetical protein
MSDIRDGYSGRFLGLVGTLGIDHGSERTGKKSQQGMRIANKFCIPFKAERDDIQNPHVKGD